MKSLRVSSDGLGLTVTLLVCEFSFGAHAAHAHATKFQVNTTSDAVDIRPGDGVCETAAGSGRCSLRAAIQEANALAAGAGGARVPAHIELPVGTYRLALPGAAEDAALTGDLDINTSLRIRGAGAAATIIDAAGLDRAFDIAGAPLGPVATMSVTLSRLTIRGGHSDATGGGGLRFACPLTLQDVVIRDNTTEGRGGGVASADAIGAEPRLNVVDSVVTDNAALAFGGSGGGIDATFATSLALTRSRISQNRTRGDGGGIAAAGVEQPTTFDEVTITGNSAGDGGFGAGGGLWANCTAIARSLISGNRASGNGGGIQLSGDCGATIVDTTISGNTAGSAGAGLGQSGMLMLSHLTSAHDYATGAARRIRRFGLFSRTALHNSIVTLNLPADCAGLPISSLGYNIDSDGSCALGAPTDIPDMDPLLGPLTNDGGRSPIHALGVVSAAIDAAETRAKMAVEALDRRGSARQLDAEVDGAAVSHSGKATFDALAQGPQKPPHEPKNRHDKPDSKCP